MARGTFSPLLSRCTSYLGGRGWGNPHLPRNPTPPSRPLHTGTRVWRTEEAAGRTIRETVPENMKPQAIQEDGAGKAPSCGTGTPAQGPGEVGLGKGAISPAPRGSTPTPTGIPGILLSPPPPCFLNPLLALPGSQGQEPRLTTSRCDKP